MKPNDKANTNTNFKPSTVFKLGVTKPISSKNSTALAGKFEKAIVENMTDIKNQETQLISEIFASIIDQFIKNNKTFVNEGVDENFYKNSVLGIWNGKNLDFSDLGEEGFRYVIGLFKKELERNKNSKDKNKEGTEMQDVYKLKTNARNNNNDKMNYNVRIPVKEEEKNKNDNYAKKKKPEENFADKFINDPVTQQTYKKIEEQQAIKSVQEEKERFQSIFGTKDIKAKDVVVEDDYEEDEDFLGEEELKKEDEILGKAVLDRDPEFADKDIDGQVKISLNKFLDKSVKEIKIDTTEQALRDNILKVNEEELKRKKEEAEKQNEINRKEKERVQENLGKQEDVYIKPRGMVDLDEGKKENRNEGKRGLEVERVNVKTEKVKRYAPVVAYDRSKIEESKLKLEQYLESRGSTLKEINKIVTDFATGKGFDIKFSQLQVAQTIVPKGRSANLPNDTRLVIVDNKKNGYNVFPLLYFDYIREQNTDKFTELINGKIKYFNLQTIGIDGYVKTTLKEEEIKDVIRKYGPANLKDAIVYFLASSEIPAGQEINAWEVIDEVSRMSGSSLIRMEKYEKNFTTVLDSFKKYMKRFANLYLLYEDCIKENKDIFSMNDNIFYNNMKSCNGFATKDPNDILVYTIKNKKEIAEMFPTLHETENSIIYINKFNNQQEMAKEYILTYEIDNVDIDRAFKKPIMNSYNRRIINSLLNQFKVLGSDKESIDIAKVDNKFLNFQPSFKLAFFRDMIVTIEAYRNREVRKNKTEVKDRIFKNLKMKNGGKKGKTFLQGSFVVEKDDLFNAIINDSEILGTFTNFLFAVDPSLNNQQFTGTLMDYRYSFEVNKEKLKLLLGVNSTSKGVPYAKQTRAETNHSEFLMADALFKEYTNRPKNFEKFENYFDYVIAKVKNEPLKERGVPRLFQTTFIHAFLHLQMIVNSMATCIDFAYDTPEAFSLYGASLYNGGLNKLFEKIMKVKKVHLFNMSDNLFIFDTSDSKTIKYMSLDLIKGESIHMHTTFELIYKIIKLKYKKFLTNDLKKFIKRLLLSVNNCKVILKLDEDQYMEHVLSYLPSGNVVTSFANHIVTSLFIFILDRFEIKIVDEGFNLTDDFVNLGHALGMRFETSIKNYDLLGTNLIFETGGNKIIKMDILGHDMIIYDSTKKQIYKYDQNKITLRNKYFTPVLDYERFLKQVMYNKSMEEEGRMKINDLARYKGMILNSFPYTSFKNMIYINVLTMTTEMETENQYLTGKFSALIKTIVKYTADKYAVGTDDFNVEMLPLIRTLTNVYPPNDADILGILNGDILGTRIQNSMIAKNIKKVNAGEDFTSEYIWMNIGTKPQQWFRNPKLNIYIRHFNYIFSFKWNQVYEDVVKAMDILNLETPQKEKETYKVQRGLYKLDMISTNTLLNDVLTYEIFSEMSSNKITVDDIPYLKRGRFILNKILNRFLIKVVAPQIAMKEQSSKRGTKGALPSVSSFEETVFNFINTFFKLGEDVKVTYNKTFPYIRTRFLIRNHPLDSETSFALLGIFEKLIKEEERITQILKLDEKINVFEGKKFVPVPIMGSLKDYLMFLNMKVEGTLVTHTFINFVRMVSDIRAKNLDLYIVPKAYKNFVDISNQKEIIKLFLYYRYLDEPFKMSEIPKIVQEGVYNESVKEKFSNYLENENFDYDVDMFNTAAYMKEINTPKPAERKLFRLITKMDFFDIKERFSNLSKISINKGEVAINMFLSLLILDGDVSNDFDNHCLVNNINENDMHYYITLVLSLISNSPFRRVMALEILTTFNKNNLSRSLGRDYTTKDIDSFNNSKAIQFYNTINNKIFQNNSKVFKKDIVESKVMEKIIKMIVKTKKINAKNGDLYIKNISDLWMDTNNKTFVKRIDEEYEEALETNYKESLQPLMSANFAKNSDATKDLFTITQDKVLLNLEEKDIDKKTEDTQKVLLLNMRKQKFVDFKLTHDFKYSSVDTNPFLNTNDLVIKNEEQSRNYRNAPAQVLKYQTRTIKKAMIGDAKDEEEILTKYENRMLKYSQMKNEGIDEKEAVKEIFGNEREKIRVQNLIETLRSMKGNDYFVDKRNDDTKIRDDRIPHTLDMYRKGSIHYNLKRNAKREKIQKNTQFKEILNFVNNENEIIFRNRMLDLANQVLVNDVFLLKGILCFEFLEAIYQIKIGSSIVIKDSFSLRFNHSIETMYDSSSRDLTIFKYASQNHLLDSYIKNPSNSPFNIRILARKSLNSDLNIFMNQRFRIKYVGDLIIVKEILYRNKDQDIKFDSRGIKKFLYGYYDLTIPIHEILNFYSVNKINYAENKHLNYYIEMDNFIEPLKNLCLNFLYKVLANISFAGFLNFTKCCFKCMKVNSLIIPINFYFIKEKKVGDVTEMKAYEIKQKYISLPKRDKVFTYRKSMKASNFVLKDNLEYVKNLYSSTQKDYKSKLGKESIKRRNRFEKEEQEKLKEIKQKELVVKDKDNDKNKNKNRVKDTKEKEKQQSINIELTEKAFGKNPFKRLDARQFKEDRMQGVKQKFGVQVFTQETNLEPPKIDIITKLEQKDYNDERYKREETRKKIERKLWEDEQEEAIYKKELNRIRDEYKYLENEDHSKYYNDLMDMFVVKNDFTNNEKNLFKKEKMEEKLGNVKIADELYKIVQEENPMIKMNFEENKGFIENIEKYTNDKDEDIGIDLNAIEEIDLDEEQYNEQQDDKNIELEF